MGIEEDSEKGIPVTWFGIKNEEKLLERIHQFASQVEPIPLYDVTVTDEKDNMVFILLRVFEGERTPYFVQNDSNIWVRTGNISNPIDIASPDALELLYKKRESAEKLRKIQTDRTEEIYSAAIERQEKRRLLLLANAQEAERSNIVKQVVGSNSSMCSMTIQPYYPRKNFIAPFQLKQSISKITTSLYGQTFPDEYKAEMIPYGIFSMNWRSYNGYINIAQLYGNGLIFNSEDVLRVDDEGTKIIYLASIAILIFITLQSAVKFYKLIGFQGSLIGNINLQNSKECIIKPIIPAGWSDFYDYNTCLLDKYDWEIDTDTSIISDNNSLDSLFREILDNLYVSFNYSPPLDKLYYTFFNRI